jgi:hypothetical protein
VAETDPEHVRIVTPLLSQKQFSTTDRYYIKAQSLKASRAQNAHLRELRLQLQTNETQPFGIARPARSKIR